MNMILLPLVELNSDNHSYGYRPFRSAKNAIGTLRLNLQSGKENKWILDADIKGGGFFDNINHDWLIANICLPDLCKQILISWLKAGAVYHNKFIETESGTPQGGIISPTLANFTLNGLEKAVYDSILSLTKSKEIRIFIT